MHVIAPWQTSVTLFRDDGEVWTFKSIAHARRELGMSFIRQHVGAHFVESGHTPVVYGGPERGYYRGEPVYRCARYVMRDDFGQPLTAVDFQIERKRLDWWTRRYGSYCGYGPVPGTGRRSHGHSLRRPRTMNERRATFHFPEEGEVGPRPNRNIHHIPQAWDDIVRYSERRCWKRHRCTQWRCED